MLPQNIKLNADYSVLHQMYFHCILIKQPRTKCCQSARVCKKWNTPEANITVHLCVCLCKDHVCVWPRGCVCMRVKADWRRKNMYQLPRCGGFSGGVEWWEERARGAGWGCRARTANGWAEDEWNGENQKHLIRLGRGAIEREGESTPSYTNAVNWMRRSRPLCHWQQRGFTGA